MPKIAHELIRTAVEVREPAGEHSSVDRATQLEVDDAEL